MKISIFVLHLGFGGIEKYAITVANLLAENHEVELISTYKVVETPSFPVEGNIRITYLLSDKKPNIKKWKESIRKKKLLSVVREGAYALLLLKFKKKVNIRAIKQCTSDVIISTRDYHNALIQKYADKSIVKITSEHNHHNGNKKYIKKVVSSCYKFDYMLPISQELTTFYKEKLQKVDVRYIPFCIESPAVQMQKKDTSLSLISVGRLSPEKDTIELIEIFADIQKEITNIHLHIVGDGSLMDELKRKINELELQEYVTVHGFLYKEQIDILYGQSDLFLMTSLTESFGFVLLEAMVCGVPCIAYDSAQGAREIIRDGKNGYLIANRNRKQYVERVICILQQKDIYEQLKKEAKITAHMYDKSVTKARWNQLMREIESEKGQN